MSRNLTSGMVTAVTAQKLSPILLCELNFLSGYVRAWSGYGTLMFLGNAYNGVGDFGGVSQAEETTDTRSTSVNFTMSGIPSTLIATVLGDQYQGRSAKLWMGCMDNTGAIIADPFMLFAGRMDTVQISEAGQTSSITVTAESDLVDLTSPRVRRFTMEDQLEYFPTDFSLQYIAPLQNQSLTWGKVNPTSFGTPGAPVAYQPPPSYVPTSLY